MVYSPLQSQNVPWHSRNFRESQTNSTISLVFSIHHWKPSPPSQIAKWDEDISINIQTAAMGWDSDPIDHSLNRSVHRTLRYAPFTKSSEPFLPIFVCSWHQDSSLQPRRRKLQSPPRAHMRGSSKCTFPKSYSGRSISAASPHRAETKHHH